MAAATSASAAGLGAGASSVVLGQPLDFAVQVRLEPGDVLAPDCLAAEVTLGDRRLAAALVRTAVEMTGPQTARIRVLTSPAVDEPVVGVVVNANCGTLRLSRRFVVMADPPTQTATAPSGTASYAPAQALAPTMVVPVAPDAPLTSDTSAAPAAAAPPMAAPASAPRTVERSPAQGLGHRASAPPRTAAARAERRAERRAAAAARAEAPRRARRTPPAVAAAPVTPGSRLRLEAAEPVAAAPSVGVEEALAAVAQAASAARDAAAAASVAAARIASLERDVEGLRKEAGASRELATQLRDQLARAEGSGRWTWPLLALVLLLTAVAAWLAWRLNAAERARQRGWQAAAATPAPASELTPSKLPTAPIPFVTSELTLPARPVPRSRPLHAWPSPAPVDSTLPPEAEVRTVAVPKLLSPPPPPPVPEVESAMARTEPMPSLGLVDDSAARDVSIEELLDLEQQAEFFVVLGQDDAAIDLLVEHLRHTGGGSPLPYLKLLEIYRRRGDRADYERMRTRFNHRFNAYAPEWDADLSVGRTLEDYAGVLPRLQQVWPRPLDAMAELEALLFRKSRGDLFDLPAYREVLFLYSLARDLLDREAANGGSVDLLLPLADGSEFGSTSPAPFLNMDRDAAAAAPGVEHRPTAPLDFDLSADTGPATSIFGPLDDTPDRPRRR